MPTSAPALRSREGRRLWQRRLTLSAVIAMTALFRAAFGATSIDIRMDVRDGRAVIEGDSAVGKPATGIFFAEEGEVTFRTADQSTCANLKVAGVSGDSRDLPRARDGSFSLPNIGYYLISCADGHGGFAAPGAFARLV